MNRKEGVRVRQRDAERIAMDSNIPIVNYQRTDATLLLNHAERLFENDVFHQYLTPPQLIVLNKVLSVEDNEIKGKIWEELMSGNVFLDVEKVVEDTTKAQEEIQMNERSEIESSSSQARADIQDLTVEGSKKVEIKLGNDDEKSEEKESVDTPSGKVISDLANQEVPAQSRNGNRKEEDVTEEPDFSEFDLQDLQQQMCGCDFVGNLSLKIRYVLWERAIDPLYDIKSQGNLKSSKLEETQTANLEQAKSAIGSLKIITQEAETSTSNIHDEDDDYDFDDEEEKESAPERSDERQNSTNTQMTYQENGRLILKLKISKETLAELGVTNTQSIIENFNKIYHNFENDRETLLKRLKLEESDKLLEPSKKRKRSDSSDEAKEQDEEYASDIESKKPKTNGSLMSNLPVTLGSANLSLKHLLASIQENKSKLSISDYELRHLIMDVRKNRSKWASDDKIGQEELYDACEKVVLELRNYTEHSTAFLNKVSKREAPNYYQIIKKPMDLNTVLKKLKTYQYTSKQQFVDDLMLIWKNCLTYNSDPKHFLRGHAIAMQKKSLTLIPLIPDIVVRDRTEVEKEIEEIDKENGKDVEAEEVSGTGRKGGNVRGIKHVSEDDIAVENSKKRQEGVNQELRSGGSSETNYQAADLPTQDNSHDSERQKIIDGNINSLSQENRETESGKKLEHESVSTPKKADTDNYEAAEEENKKNMEQEEEKEVEEEEEGEGEGEAEGEGEVEGEGEGEVEIEEEEDDDEDEDDEGGLDSEMYLVERDDDKDDLELSTWKSLTATARAEICVKRANLFKSGKLNSDSVAILRNPGKMKEFDQFLKEYKEEKEGELQRRKLEQESMMKNGFGTVIKQEEDEISQMQLQDTQSLVAGSGIGKDSNEIEVDDSMFLMEYNVANAVPELGYRGIDNEMLDKEEAAMVQRILSEGQKGPSALIANRNLGLSPKMDSNIHLIQEIRHICHKISLIRMLQNPQNPTQQSKNAMANANNQIWNTHRYKYTDIDENLDIDPVSRLSTHNYKNDKQLIWRVMHKNVSKIAMSNGFESTQPTAINMLTEIAGDYLSNLIKTIKVHQESTSLNIQKPSDILRMSLQENGINKPDDLYTYIETEFIKKTNKLKDIKQKLNAFLKDLLRPTLQELSERNFDDESQSFMTGDFSTELTGEDFFGFKDLGLDKEFGVLSNSVPLQLLTFQFRGKGAETKVKDKKIQPEEFDNVTYKWVTREHIDQGMLWDTLKPLLNKAYNRTKTYYSKNGKNKASEIHAADALGGDLSQKLLEDDDIPAKSKSSGKPRLPPTGKINTNYKKKLLADAFFLPDTPDEDREEKKLDTNQSKIVDNIAAADSKDFEDLFGTENTPPGSSFSLSLPRVDE